jgi:hypothetical protein
MCRPAITLDFAAAPSACVTSFSCEGKNTNLRQPLFPTGYLDAVHSIYQVHEARNRQCVLTLVETP